ncbi:HAD-IIIC family phosphatase [Planobispora siamensis]|uniref:Carrier domain-containing protein n=1 Tax=Planobispora siamensis TaxID=936338 RepID=A0A8J3SMP4_9ACTN|nr:HAD-IIIC family phosphatase [Planobispora siamensis]GIH95230.1 hypothetical protein Psi01_58600 [Planobispora siamensis]
MNDNAFRAFRLGVAATFTAEPLAGVLRFWLAELGIGGDVDFAPYGQVFPSLLDPGGVLGRADAVAVLVRAQDLTAGSGSGSRSDGVDDGGLDRVDAVAADLAAAVRTSAKASGTPHLLMICPPSPEAGSDAHARLAAVLQEACVGDPGVQVLTSAEPYEVEEVHDAFADRIGNVPYTEPYFAALATALARRLHAMIAARPKVIVADCDGTLWDGVVGEDGPDGVTIGPDRLRVWHELSRQVAAGRLLCLASKNDEKDVREVFARHPGLPIGPDQITATRIGWDAKSRALRSLAAELNLGLDSFVFLDDSPVECAEVRAGCPEALTLRLPADPAEAARFLRHCWPLDHTAVTDADRARGRYYREQYRRDQAMREMSLTDFFATLDLSVTITPAGPEHAERVSQLARRTNQFNLSAERHPAGELHVVEVRDRFGDYGLVGLTAARTDGDTLRADAFLLSCRALGRGVEHRMLAHLGALAGERGLARVALAHRVTARNQPARDFLAGLPGAAAPADGDLRWHVLDADAAAAVVHVPAETAAPGSGTRAAAPASEAAPRADWERVEGIATRLTDVDAVLRALRTAAPAPVSAAVAVAATAVEAAVMRWWAEILDIPPASVDDGFFELGGHSLRLVQFMARVRAEYGVELPFETLYTTTFTVAEIARVIEEQQVAQAGNAELEELLEELEGLSDEEIEALLVRGES